MGTKIGRNEPCPCGSGKKYKRCCADRDAEEARAARAAAEEPPPPWASPVTLPPLDAVGTPDITGLLDEITQVADDLAADGGRGATAYALAVGPFELEGVDPRSPEGELLMLLITLAPRCLDPSLSERWTSLVVSRLSVRARALLARIQANPPRVWRRTRGRDRFHAAPVTRFKAREVEASLYVAAPGVDGLHDERCHFGWSFSFEGHTVLFYAYALGDPELLEELLEVIEAFEADGPLGEAETWELALELTECIVFDDLWTDELGAAAEELKGLDYEEVWRERVAEGAIASALNHAVQTMVGPRQAIRATARASASRLVELAHAAVAGAAESVAWAARLGVDVRLPPEKVLASLGFDASGHAPGLERDTLTRHPLALLAVDPEGAGLPAVDPRMPIGAALAMAKGTQRKALDKALTRYEREVRFAHLIKSLFAQVEGRGAVGWRYDLVQVGGCAELLGGELFDAPLSRLGLTKATMNRLAAALRKSGDVGRQPTLGDLPASGSELGILPGVGEKTRDALTDALEELFSAWRWQRAGLDRASWAAATPAEDAARDTLSAGLDQLDALFR